MDEGPESLEVLVPTGASAFLQADRSPSPHNLGSRWGQSSEHCRLEKGDMRHLWTWLGKEVFGEFSSSKHVNMPHE